MADNNNVVYGTLRVNTSFEFNINYEEFEVVYLTIHVEDENQVIPPGEDTAMLVVRIEDENDNAPEFIENTLETYRRVFEEAETGTLIGNILAIDIDGPGNNIIEYTITYACFM